MSQLFDDEQSIIGFAINGSVLVSKFCFLQIVRPSFQLVGCGYYITDGDYQRLWVISLIAKEILFSFQGVDGQGAVITPLLQTSQAYSIEDTAEIYTN